MAGTPAKNASASAFASKCGTRYFSCSIGMRLSSAFISLRVSSSVDQITCLTPAAFAASAMFLAWAFSFSPEKCSQKFVTP